ncbi:MAG: hypothetical protein QXZ25_01285 [Candidatus Bathyarchaeia archaeon]
MKEEKLEEADIGTLLHAILFAYQKAVKDILGTGAAIFVHPVLDTMKRINEKAGVNLLKGRDIDEVFENMSVIMPTTGIIREFRFEKLAPERYVLHVDGCVWAPHIHEELKPKDVTCPFALMAMAVFEKTLKKKVKVTDSEYYKEGTKTLIEPL